MLKIILKLFILYAITLITYADTIPVNIYNEEADNYYIGVGGGSFLKKGESLSEFYIGRKLNSYFSIELDAVGDLKSVKTKNSPFNLEGEYISLLPVFLFPIANTGFSLVGKSGFFYTFPNKEFDAGIGAQFSAGLIKAITPHWAIETMFTKKINIAGVKDNNQAVDASLQYTFG